MKKVVLLSVLVAGGLFAASLENSTNEELYKMVANADAKTLSDISFEIDKRAGKLEYEAKQTKRGFKAEFRKKMEAMSVEEKEKFIADYKKGYNEKAQNLSVKEAKMLDIELKDHKEKHFKAPKFGGFKEGGKEDKK